jgi:glycosyltransferase involved in cell wall biosynthesis
MASTRLAQPRKRRVLAVVRHPLGGVRTHILYTYPILMDAGYRFTFVVPDNESYPPFRADVENWPDVEIVAAPHRDRDKQKPKFRSTVRGLLRQGRFSLIHSHGIQAAVPNVFANFGIGLPHVMTSQDVFCRLDLSGIAGRVKLHALTHVLRRLDALIAVSEDTRDDHLQYLPGLRNGPCRVAVIPNGINLEQYPLRNPGAPGSGPGLREKLGIGPETCLLGFMGRFMPQKGFGYLMEALDQVLQGDALPRPVQLLAVGSGDCLVNCRRDLQRYPHASRCIRFLEHVPSAAPVLRELDLLVVPSLWEACPILPMEAMCTGVPVLGSDCVGLREILRGTPSRMVPAADAGALAAGLESAVRAPWTDAARRYACEARRRFDVVPVAERLRTLFEEHLQ